MAEVKLGTTTAKGLESAGNSRAMASHHDRMADSSIKAGRKNVAMASHPASSQSRSEQFVAAASDHLNQAQGHVNAAKHYRGQAAKQTDAQYGGTMMGRSANFEAGRQNAAYN